VTATDPTNERLVEEGLRADFPSHAIVGEEQAALDGRVPGIDASVPTWFIDPVDGTQNFVHALLLSVVAIGLCVGGVPTVGIVYDPTATSSSSASRPKGVGQRPAHQIGRLAHSPRRGARVH